MMVQRSKPPRDLMRRAMRRRTAGVFAIVCAVAGMGESSHAQSFARDMRGIRMPPVPGHSQIPSSREPDVLVSEGQALYDAGRYKEAAASYERAMQLGVARPHEAAWNVARSYAKLGNKKQALRWAEIAERLSAPDGHAGQEVVRASSSRAALRRTT